MDDFGGVDRGGGFLGLNQGGAPVASAEGVGEDGGVGDFGGAVAGGHFPVAFALAAVVESVEDFSASVEVEDAVAGEGGVSAFHTGAVAEFQGEVLEFFVEGGAAGAFLYPAGPGGEAFKDEVNYGGDEGIFLRLGDGVAVGVGAAIVFVGHFIIVAEPDAGVHFKEVAHFLLQFVGGAAGGKGFLKPLDDAIRGYPVAGADGGVLGAGHYWDWVITLMNWWPQERHSQWGLSSLMQQPPRMNSPRSAASKASGVGSP